MKEIGRVLRLSGDKATVVFRGAAGCEGCGIGCAMRGDERHIEAINEAGASPGETVIVRFEESSFVLGSSIAYIFPLIMFILGYLLFSQIALMVNLNRFSQTAGIFGAFAFLVLAFYIVSLLFQKEIIASKRFTPVIEKVISQDFEKLND